MKIGNVVHRIESCRSTLDEARVLALHNKEEGIVVVADEQTAGRGTRGRSWFSSPGKGLYMTVVLRPGTGTERFILLSLLAALAAGEAASETLGAVTGLKWPNDIVLENRKLGGVLSESAVDGSGSRFVLLGIGMNVNHELEDFPPGIREKATSLKIAGSVLADKERLFRDLCQSLETWYNAFQQGRGEDIIHAFQERMIFSPGEEICLKSGGARIEGIYEGLDASGGLICNEGGRRRIYRSAEIQVPENER